MCSYPINVEYYIKFVTSMELYPGRQRTSESAVPAANDSVCAAEFYIKYQMVRSAMLVTGCGHKKAAAVPQPETGEFERFLRFFRL